MKTWIVGAVVGVFLLIAVWPHHHTDHRQPANPAATVTVPTGAAPDAKPYLQVAVGFTQQWARRPAGETQTAYLARLAPYIPPDLRDDLRDHPAQDGPNTTVDTNRAQVRYVAATSALITVPLGNGTGVNVTVLYSTANEWRVTQVQPAEGDLGEASGGQSP